VKEKEDINVTFLRPNRWLPEYLPCSFWRFVGSFIFQFSPRHLRYYSLLTQSTFYLLKIMPLDKPLLHPWQVSCLLPDLFPRLLGPFYLLLVQNEREGEDQGH
jgi:hypothetical protein